MVLGFLNAHTEIDVAVVPRWSAGAGLRLDLPPRGRFLHLELDRAWRELRRAARAGPGADRRVGPRGGRGLDDLVARAGADEFARAVIMAGGGLLPEHVPWLARAGVRAFQIGSAARPLGSAKAYVDADLVRTWRTADRRGRCRARPPPSRRTDAE